MGRYDSLRDELRAKGEQMHKIMVKYPTPDAVSPEDAGRVKKLSDEMQQLGATLEDLEKVDDLHRQFADYGDGGPWAAGDGRIPAGAGAPSIRDVALPKERKLADVAPRSVHAGQFGHYIKGIVTGEWSGPAAAELKAMAVGTGSAGGFLVPAPLSATVLDLARAKARVFEAGALTVPMETATLNIAKVAGDPAPAWHAENALDVVASDVSLARVTLTARTLPVIVRCSRELFEDASNLDAVVSSSVAQALALELDRAALYGTGVAPQPRGVYNTTGIGVVNLGANGAALTTYDSVIDALTSVRNNNHEPNAMLYAPRTAASLAKLKDTTGQPLQEPDVVKALAHLTTTQVPVNKTQGAATNASDLFVGEWRQLLIGLRTTFIIELLRERYVENWQVAFAAHLRADVQVANAGAFAVIQGIIP